jgi:hypothetical protein
MGETSVNLSARNKKSPAKTYYPRYDIFHDLNYRHPKLKYTNKISIANRPKNKKAKQIVTCTR